MTNDEAEVRIWVGSIGMPIPLDVALFAFPVKVSRK